MLVFLWCMCVCVCVYVCVHVFAGVLGVCACVCMCVCSMLICFVSALGSHEMGRHKLPIIIIIKLKLCTIIEYVWLFLGHHYSKII